MGVKQEKVLTLLNYLINGIETINGNIREFDILDYYENFDIDILEISEIGYKMSIENIIELKDFVKIKTFFAKNELKEMMNEYDINLIFKENHEFNTIFDERGMSIKDSGRVITLEEKKYILDYMVKNNLPIHRKIYNILAKRLVDGEMNMEKQRKV